MKEHHAVFPRPSPAALESQGRACLEQFDPRRIIYLDGAGRWKEDPRTLRDRISHGLLFELRTGTEEQALAWLREAFSPFTAEAVWPAVQKLAVPRLEKEVRAASADRFSFLVLLEILILTVKHEIFRLNAEAPAPDWDSEARAFKSEARKRLIALEEEVGSTLAEAERSGFMEALSRFKRESGSLIGRTAKLISQEEKINSALETLLREAADNSRHEEICGLIAEKIQPPMGIVTETPPSLFFPCLRLLLDQRMDVTSGIPYAASVLLGVFRDPRSAESLLRALELFPLRHTKIRENLIYTLGCLREGRAVDALIEVLDAPDEKRDAGPQGETVSFLLEQKEEAIWALGKIGFDSLRAVPALAAYADHPSARLKSYLAWTLGELGKAQKERSGGVSADVVIALLKLLKEKNRQVFEEAASALKKIDLPEFVHSLYLYHAGAISILGLKPAQRGLYELSETLHHLLQTKRRTIMAVNGDSGTGKTYFCQAIADGFAGIRADEILYLMRDTKRGQKIFNRLLGLRWLKKHIDPAYYQDYPVSEEEDDPEEYFHRFLEEHSDKRLIILDGCRDRHYFQKVIDFFYNSGDLDVEVNFRASFSTRRLNLEERECALESVRLHLAFLEEPALEDTSFYQEGIVILYDLDNSHSSRLDRQETQELFEKKRIDSWGELIRIGSFSGREDTVACRQAKIRLEEEDFPIAEEGWPSSRILPFWPGERKLKPVLGDELSADPCLLKTIPLGQINPGQIRFYAQDQIAGLGKDGSVFVLTFLDNRIFQARVEGAFDLALLGRNLYLAGRGRELLNISFERNEIAGIDAGSAPLAKVASFPPDRIVTAHKDGRIRAWDFLEKTALSFSTGLPRIRSLAVDQRGRIYAGGDGGALGQWDLEEKKAKHIRGLVGTISFIRLYPGGKILAVEETSGESPASTLKIIDFHTDIIRAVQAPPGRRLRGITVYYDGRIIAGLGASGNEESRREKTLVIFSPGRDSCDLAALSGHGNGTEDCLAMGPKIISCGTDPDGLASIRVWGSEFYVRTELGKLFIKA